MSQNVLGVPAVFVPIVHVVQHFHLLRIELPVQQLMRGCLSNVHLIE